MNTEFKLSYTEQEKASISKLMEDIYNEDISKLEPINEGDINISTIYIYDLGDKLEAKVIIRNAMITNVNFNLIPLIIIDSENSIILEEIVDLNELGTIPSNHARPYIIFFNKANLKKEVNNFENCKVTFNNNLKACNSQKIENIIIDEDIPIINNIYIEDYISKLPPIKIGDIKLINHKLFFDENGKKNFIIILINANNKSATVNNFTVGFKNSIDLISAIERVTEVYEIPPYTAKAVKISLKEENVISQDYSIDNVKLFIQATV
jgi:SLAP domain-containing protein